MSVNPVGSRQPLILLFVAALVLLPAQFSMFASTASGYIAEIELRLVAGGFDEPVYVTSPPADSRRLYVVERAGVIRIVEDGAVLPDPFLNISADVDTVHPERGLLGLAFHPAFAENGYFYITYTPRGGAWKLIRYQVTADGNRVDPASATTIISLSRDEHPAEHYGGMLAFGPDSYLYVSLGDGALEDDPNDYAQDLSSLSGSILRIDVDASEPYAIPAGNPFAGSSDARAEIWAYGLRNPWRFSFDRLSGDLYIGDVGQARAEEINVVPVGAAGGINFGWRELEGTKCSMASLGCDPSRFEPPVYEYSHAEGCVVVGGFVYRWHPASALFGRYIFGDYCSGTIWSLTKSEDGSWQRQTLLETDLNISSFGEGADGRLYVTDLVGGDVFELFDPALEATAPIIDGLNPPATASGGVICRLEIFGRNFSSGTRVVVDGDVVDSSRESSERIHITLTVAMLNGRSSRTVQVIASNGVESNPLNFPVFGDERRADAIAGWWERLDAVVDGGITARSWTFGPDGLSCPVFEPYADSPAGMRTVQYFDKGRMEITNPDSAEQPNWYVSNGLLVVELVTGKLQVGDDEFEQHELSGQPVAGDPDDDLGPTYAMLAEHTGRTPNRVGENVDKRLRRDRLVVEGAQDGPEDIALVHYDEVTGHNVAEPFWEFLTMSGPVLDGGAISEDQLFPDPVLIAGRPIIEPVWTTARVGGTAVDVLLQCFERRCLTYTPSNPPGWQVEAGNVGQHYFQWRYGE